MPGIEPDEKLALQLDLGWNGLLGVLQLNNVKVVVVTALTAWVHAYRTVYVVKILTLVVAMWWLRFCIGTIQAWRSKMWTAAQCKAGLFEFAILAAATGVIWFGTGQVSGLEWTASCWVTAWLTAETAAMASKILPHMPSQHPMTKLLAAMIRFFHSRIDNMTTIMDRLGKKKKEGDTDEPVNPVTETEVSGQIGGGESGPRAGAESR